ncbi:MAG: hypothetical protein ACI9FN_000979 [Saprospiraceae bacterium]|jgi:hypothetical protein
MSFAMAEVAVYVAIGQLPMDYFILTIYIPDTLPVKYIPESQLAKGWHRFPLIETTSPYVDQFISDENYPILKVPFTLFQMITTIY